MAKASIPVITAIQKTIEKLSMSDKYQWGHMGSCNCGFLAQEVLKMDSRTIHQRAMERHGDWNEQLNDYCPTSGHRMDDIISGLLDFGFDSDDLKHLERLSDTKILGMLPLQKRNLRHNNKEDVLTYLKTWQRMLEEEILSEVSYIDLSTKPQESERLVSER